VFTKKEILEYLEKLARWNDDVKRYWKILDELSYEEGVDYFDEFYNYLLPKKVLFYITGILPKKMFWGKVELPLDSVIETAEDEYKTIRRVAPSEFKMKFV
jgi:hypothetical protein